MCDFCDLGYGKRKPQQNPPDSSCMSCGKNCNPKSSCDINGAGNCDSCIIGYGLNS